MSETKKKRGLWWKIPLGIVVVLFGLTLCMGGGTPLLDGEKPAKEAFKKWDDMLSYTKASTGRYKRGDRVYFDYATVVSVQGNNRVLIRLQRWKGAAAQYVVGIYPDGERDVADGNVTHFYGRYLGQKSGTPLIQIDYAGLWEPK